MVALQWDVTGTRFFETGVDRGVLYIPNASGNYVNGYAWNGLTTVTEAPSGAESNPQYADNIKYLNLISAEEFGATLEAFTYPQEFAQCDGSAIVYGGVVLGQQSRRTFGLAYRTLVGNDLAGRDLGYKIHLIYGCTASPSERSYTTVNDSPEALSFSWEVTTTAVAVGTVAGTAYKPLASLTIDSTKVSAANLAALEQILYGTAGTDPRLPSPAEVVAMFSGSVTTVAVPLSAPTVNAAGGQVTIPSHAGIDYTIDGVVIPAGTSYSIPTVGSKLVIAQVKPGFVLPADTLTQWRLTRTS